MPVGEKLCVMKRILGIVIGAWCGMAARASELPPDAETNRFGQWWDGAGFTGRWFGARPWLEERGLRFTGQYYGAYFGVVDSERGARGFWDQGLQFGGEWNPGEMWDLEAARGIKAFASFRWRDPSPDSNPNAFVGASSMFNPSNWQSGTQFRVLAFGLEVASHTWFPKEDLFVLRGGWLQPQAEFLVQPLSKLFLNNAVNSAKGIGGNIPFSSSFSTWGGTLRVEPVDWLYAKAGLFMAFPEATSSSNHGLAYAGFGPDPSQNGLMAIGEVGLLPKLGPDELPGRYVAGAYWWGNEADSFNGTPNYGQYGFYWQADQMLFREPSGEDGSPGKDVRPGESKGFKQPVEQQRALGKQGLSLFSVVSMAPKYNNTFPFYFHAGLVYRGLIPTRDDDQLIFALAYGGYSYYRLLEDRSAGRSEATYTMFLEWGYRTQITEWAYAQPFVQYAIRPNGSSAVSNATILGIAVGLAF